MAVLLLRLAGPMQSWGTRSRFDDRDTELFPSKSGIIGLVCAAQGRPRIVPLDDLASLRMAARADLPGRLETDYQTAMDVPTAKPGGVSRTMPSRRHYLADAVFLVGLEGPEPLLRELHAALAAPVWPLSLGRKSFPPGLPVYLEDGLRTEPLETALTSFWWLPSLREAWLQQPPRPPREKELDVELECLAGEEGEPRQDVPLSFDWERRAFTVRRVRRITVPVPPFAPATPMKTPDEETPDVP